MVKGKIISYGEDDKEVVRIKKEVFKENVSEKSTGLDIHVLVENDEGEYVATGTLTYTMEKYIISEIAVLSEYQNKKYGDFVVRMLVNKAFMSKAENVELICNKDIEMFFKKVGFEQIDVLNENDIRMKLEFSNFKTACGHNCFKN